MKEEGSTIEHPRGIQYDLKYDDSEKEKDPIFLNNFEGALQRHLEKEKWTFVEKNHFFAPKIYVIGLNILLIPQIIQFGDQYNWLPRDTLACKILFYFNGIIALTFYNDFVMEAFKKEFLSEYSSREEQALYFERHSVSRSLPKKVYLPLFLGGFAVPITAAIYEGFRNKHLYGKITGLPWLDNFLTFLPTTPLYLGFTISGVQITVSLLAYLKPLQEWMLRTCRRESAILQAKEFLVELIRMHLLQIFKEALKNYRNDSHRCTHYTNIFSKLTKATDASESESLNLEEGDQEPTSNSLDLELLISIIETGRNHSIHSSRISNPSHRFISLKSLIIPTAIITQLAAFLFFNQIQEPDFFQESLLFLSFNINPDVSFSVYSIPAGALVFSFYTLVNSALFNKAMSLLLNKLPSFLYFLLYREHNVPIAIQRHPYLYALSQSVVTTSIILSLPFISLQIFSNWLLSGYDNEHQFDGIQYSGENAFVYFYLPATLTFAYMAAQAWHLTTSAFKYVVGYFSNTTQRNELRLEKCLKIAIRLLSHCKPDALLNILGDISDSQFSRLKFFNGRDPEELLQEAYRRKGISPNDDPAYSSCRKAITQLRSNPIVNIESIQHIQEVYEDDDMEEKGNKMKISDNLPMKDFISLTTQLYRDKNRKVKIEKTKNETSSLIESPDKKTSFFSKEWRQKASCNIF